LNAADLVVDIIDLTCGACCAEVVNQIVSGLADTSGLNPIFICSADGSADTVAALTAHFLVTGDTVATLGTLVIDLGVWVAGGADITN
jgi:hypothetical protein